MRGETGEQLRVVIAEDHYLVREGTRALLDSAPDVEVVEAVGTAPELLRAVEDTEPDAVLTDVRMPPHQGMDGILAAREIRRLHPDLGVVVLSQHAEEAYVATLLQDGAEGLGYLLKERVADRAQLLHALRETRRGGSVIDPLMVDALLRGRGSRANSPLAQLTERELDVLRVMAGGASNAAIGVELHLSTSSVEKHVNAVFTKLDLVAEPAVHRRVVAVVTYLRESPA